MTREEALSILKSILADLQRGAKDTDNVSCCLEYGFITYGKAKDCIKALEQEPTTKNDLGVDAVSRQAVLNTLDNMDSALDVDRTVEAYKELLKECYKVLPSVTPQDPILDKLRAEITTLQNRCYALTKGTMCAFCKYVCEYKAESEETDI